MATARIDARNQIVLPKEAREHLGVGPGDELLIVPKGSRLIVIRKPDDILKTLYGGGKGVYGSVRRYLRRERRSWSDCAEPRR